MQQGSQHNGICLATSSSCHVAHATRTPLEEHCDRPGHCVTTTAFCPNRTPWHDGSSFRRAYAANSPDTYRGECRYTCQHPDKSACRKMSRREGGLRARPQHPRFQICKRVGPSPDRHDAANSTSECCNKQGSRNISAPKLQRACSMVKMVCSADKCRAKILATVFPRAGDRRFSSGSR